MKFKYRAGSLLLLVIIGVTTLWGCGKKDSIDKKSNYLAVSILEGKNVWELYKNKSKQTVTVVLNGKVKSSKSFKVESEVKIMKLPDTKGVTAENITTRDEFSKCTWNASLDDAAKQIKWYEVAGYNTIFKAETSKFIEVYMEKEKENYKRILIMQGQLSVADVKEFKFTEKDIDNYIF